jgi:HSP20 family protein
MANLTRFDPFSDMLSLRDTVDRLFDERLFRPLAWRAAEGDGLMPALDVRQNPDELIVEVALPGVQPDDVDITITGQTLVIRGEMKAEERDEGDSYLYRERRSGSFHRQLQLPVRVAGDSAEATFEHGVLTLRIPKAEEVKPRQIQVKAAARQVGPPADGEAT